MRHLWLTSFLFYLICSLPNLGLSNPESENECVTLQLGYQYQFEFAGYIAAMEKGYYEEEGMEVVMSTDRGLPNITQDYLDKYDYFIGTGSQILSVPNDSDIIVVVSIYQHSPLTLLSKRSYGVEILRDLEGKTIATGSENMAMLLSAGVDIATITNIGPGSDMSLLEDNKVQAISHFLINDPVDESVYTIFRPLEYGVDFYGECLVTTRSELEKNPERVARMYRATIKGWEYAIEHPEEIIDIILTKYNPELDPDHLEREARIVINSLILPNLFPIGYTDKAKWENMEEMSRQFGLVSGNRDWDSFLYPVIKDEQARAEEDIKQWIVWFLGISVLLGTGIIAYISSLRQAVDLRTNELVKANQRLEDQTKELEELNKFKDKILAVVSHDVKGPIANMETLIQMVQSEAISEEEFKQLIAQLKKKVGEVSGFILNILFWAKSQQYGFSVKPKKIALKRLIDNVISLYDSEIQDKSLDVKVEVLPGQKVLADESMAQLILRNLFSNAMKFSGQGSVVTFSCQDRGDMIELVVRDNGVGMTEERLKDVQNGLSISSPGIKNELGSGLGLLLCREFVELNHGELNIQSQEGKGTEVTIRLPKADRQ